MHAAQNWSWRWSGCCNCSGCSTAMLYPAILQQKIRHCLQQSSQVVVSHFKDTWRARNTPFLTPCSTLIIAACSWYFNYTEFEHITFIFFCRFPLKNNHACASLFQPSRLPSIWQAIHKLVWQACLASLSGKHVYSLSGKLGYSLSGKLVYSLKSVYFTWCKLENYTL